ncbi:MAG: MBL fold metallo-hydrolase [Clostridia bacterium]|nr:MBL fold metallo-hydrolase [Clostridia bacterium]
MLELPVNIPDGKMYINPILLWDEDTAVLVDTGLPGQLELVREEIEKVGIAFDRLNMVIITHQDMDHIGNLASVQRMLEDVKVVSHMDERPYIEFEKIPLKLTPERLAKMEAGLSGTPHKSAKEAFKARVDIAVKDGEEFNVCGGIEIIHTPGHTPGHQSLYLKKYKTLISGDALNVVNGRLVGPNPQFTHNMETAMQSLKKLLKYDIQTVICYHGGVFNENIHQRLEELISPK